MRPPYAHLRRLLSSYLEPLVLKSSSSRASQSVVIVVAVTALIVVAVSMTVVVNMAVAPAAATMALVVVVAIVGLVVIVAMGDRGAPHDRGWSRAGGIHGRGRGVFVKTDSATEATANVEPGATAIEDAADVVGACSASLPDLPALSRGRAGPLPAHRVEASGVKRGKYGNAAG